MVGCSSSLLPTAPALAEPPPPHRHTLGSAAGLPAGERRARADRKLLGARSTRQPSVEPRAPSFERTDAFVSISSCESVNLAGTRSIESNSCEDLAGAAAVELGLLIHSAEATGESARHQPTPLPPVSGPAPSGSRSDGTSDGRPARATSDASTAAPAPDGAKSESKRRWRVKPRSSRPGWSRPRRWHILVQAPVLELGVGPLPQPARGIGLSLGLEYARWQLQLQGLSWQRQSVPAPDFPGYGANVDRIGAAFWGCREYRRSWFGFSPCLTVGMERVSATWHWPEHCSEHAHAIGNDRGRRRSRAAPSGQLDPRLLMAVGGQIELSRPQISMNGVGSVYQFAPAALRVEVGLEWSL